MKSAVKNRGALVAVLPLGELAPEAPAALRNSIRLGINLSLDGKTLAEIEWLLAGQSHPHTHVQQTPLMDRITQQLAAWFQEPNYAFDIPLSAPRTAFQQRLRTLLCKTRSGDTLTYGEVAQRLTSAPRAVGQALGSNPLPLVVPCHRVISAGQNRLTGFNHASTGPMLSLKAWLLERECRA